MVSGEGQRKPKIYMAVGREAILIAARTDAVTKRMASDRYPDSGFAKNSDITRGLTTATRYCPFWAPQAHSIHTYERTQILNDIMSTISIRHVFFFAKRIHHTQKNTNPDTQGMKC
jgi:hypothetical protein